MSAPSPAEILVLCTGNICRSPMAQRLLEHALKAESGPLGRWRVASAGVGAIDGEPPSRNSVEALRKVGLHLDGFLSRRVDASMLESARVVLVMTEGHRQALRRWGGDALERVRLWREFLPPEAGAEIPDPFGGPLSVYEACRDSLVEGLPPLLSFLRSEAGKA